MKTGVVLFVITASVCVMNAGCTRHHQESTEIIMRVLDKVPIGSSHQRVSEWLSSEKIEHSGFGQTEANAVQAIVRGKTINLVRTDYVIVFRFNNRGLAEYDVKPEFTGL